MKTGRKEGTDVALSKSPTGQKLMAALLKELHRRGVVPVKGELPNAMCAEVARKIRDTDSGIETSGVWGKWSGEAAERIQNLKRN
jgi:hypothetical protein